MTVPTVPDLGEGLDKMTSAFDKLTGAFDKLGSGISDFFDGITNALAMLQTLCTILLALVVVGIVSYVVLKLWSGGGRG